MQRQRFRISPQKAGSTAPVVRSTRLPGQSEKHQHEKKHQPPVRAAAGGGWAAVPRGAGARCRRGLPSACRPRGSAGGCGLCPQRLPGGARSRGEAAGREQLPLAVTAPRPAADSACRALHSLTDALPRATELPPDRLAQRKANPRRRVPAAGGRGAGGGREGGRRRKDPAPLSHLSALPHTLHPFTPVTADFPVTGSGCQHKSS